MITLTPLSAMILSTSLLHPETLKHPLEEYACLTEAIHYEAKGEPVEGKIAVGSVIINRMKSKRYPSSICEVISQKYQFSYRNSGYVVLELPNRIEERSFKESSDLAVGLLEGTISSNVGNSLLYYNPKKVTPKWSKGYYKRVTKGNHLFLEKI